MTFTVRVIPRSAKTKIDGMRGEAVLVRLAAPPVDGAANEALVELLAHEFHRPSRDVTIVAGHTSRDKRVQISGLSDKDGAERLSAILNRER